MPLVYVEITGTFEDGQGNPLSGTATFTPNTTVYAAGVPVCLPEVPVEASITGGQLQAASGQPLKLLATDNTSLAFIGQTGFFFWTAELTIAGAAEDPWSFFLPSSPSSTDLFALASTAAGGFTNPMTAAGDLIDGGASGAPERLAGNTGTATALLSSTGTGTAATAPSWQTLAELGIPAPTDVSPLSTLLGGTGLSEATAAELLAALLAGGGGAMGAELSPKVVTLTDAATIAIDAAAGNDQRVTLGGNRTMGVPSNPADGQVLALWIGQPSSGGPYTVTWPGTAGGYSFGSGSAPALSTPASAVDVVAFRYNSALQAWCYQGPALGFTAL